LFVWRTTKKFSADGSVASAHPSPCGANKEENRMGTVSQAAHEPPSASWYTDNTRKPADAHAASRLADPTSLLRTVSTAKIHAPRMAMWVGGLLPVQNDVSAKLFTSRVIRTSPAQGAYTLDSDGSSQTMSGTIM
jgi:hypothetical protein